MSYYKRVAYIDYYKNGDKVGNAGFVKLMKFRDGRESLQIHISNFPLRDASREMVKILVGTQEVLLGQMEINERRGMLQIKSLEEVLKNAGITRETGSGMQLKVEIAPLKVLLCELESEERKGMPEEETAEHKPAKNFRQEKITQMEHRPEEGLQEEDYQEDNRREEKQPEEKNWDEKPLDENCRDVKQQEVTSREEKQPEEKVWEDKPPEENEHVMEPEAGTGQIKDVENRDALSKDVTGYPRVRTVQAHRDKWKQLSEMFPHIKPFQDEREYLRLDMRDLIILPRLYYRLVENSFLLHGYYNYEHLILTKLYKRGAEKYYIGVPGNYYEKEKQVAVLFGFESFEPKVEPAREGDYGYYMISVDI